MYEKSNEITAVPLLLDKIDISGKIITADAMSMQKDIIEKIRKKEERLRFSHRTQSQSTIAVRYGVEDSLKGQPPL